MLRWRMNLSVSPERFAARWPWLAHWRWVRGRSARASPAFGVDPVVLLGVLAGQRPFVEVGEPAALVAGERVRVLVDLGDRGDGAFQERPVVRHDHDRRGQAEDEPFEPVEPVEVEVVGGLVEEEDVEPGQQQRGELGAGGLTTRQVAHGAV